MNEINSDLKIQTNNDLTEQTVIQRDKEKDKETEKETEKEKEPDEKEVQSPSFTIVSMDELRTTSPMTEKQNVHWLTPQSRALQTIQNEKEPQINDPTDESPKSHIIHDDKTTSTPNPNPTLTPNPQEAKESPLVTATPIDIKMPFSTHPAFGTYTLKPVDKEISCVGAASTTRTITNHSVSTNDTTRNCYSSKGITCLKGLFYGNCIYVPIVFLIEFYDTSPFATEIKVLNLCFGVIYHLFLFFMLWKIKILLQLVIAQTPPTGCFKSTAPITRTILICLFCCKIFGLIVDNYISETYKLSPPQLSRLSVYDCVWNLGAYLIFLNEMYLY